MSYHLPPGATPNARMLPAGGLLPAIQPHRYPLVALSQGDLVPQRDASATRKLLLVFVVILLIVAVAYLFTRASKTPMTRNKAAKKLSTPDLAKAMYERLDRRGGANPAVLRSLQSYASKK